MSLPGEVVRQLRAQAATQINAHIISLGNPRLRLARCRFLQGGNLAGIVGILQRAKDELQLILNVEQ